MVFCVLLVWGRMGYALENLELVGMLEWGDLLDFVMLIFGMLYLYALCGLCEGSVIMEHWKGLRGLQRI